MTGPMPTGDGDIVITHAEDSRSLYLIWRVTEDGQQAHEGITSSAFAMRREGALELAAMMVKEHGGAIYMQDPTSGEWICATRDSG